MTSNRWEVPAENLRAHFDSLLFPFTTTEELPDLDGIIGQEHAVRAMQFGLQVRVLGYNSFQDPNRPKALCFPPGKGREFLRDMESLIAAVRGDLSQIFRSEDYQVQRQALEARFSKAHAGLRKALKQRAKDCGFRITSSRQGVAATLLFKGTPVQVRPFAVVHQDDHMSITPKRRELDEATRFFLQHVHSVQEEVNAQLTALNRQMAFYASQALFEGLRQLYQPSPR